MTLPNSARDSAFLSIPDSANNCTPRRIPDSANPCTQLSIPDIAKPYVRTAAFQTLSTPAYDSAYLSIPDSGKFCTHHSTFNDSANLCTRLGISQHSRLRQVLHAQQNSMTLPTSARDSAFLSILDSTKFCTHSSIQ